MRYHVIYQPGDIIYYTTNYTKAQAPNQMIDPEFMLNMPESQVVTWELNDLPLTEKFIWNYKKTIQDYIDNPTNELNYAYDIYNQPTEEPTLKSRKVMNDIIDKFNNLEWGWFKIDDQYRLDTENINNVKIKELNILHDIFENNLPILIEKHSKGEVSTADMEIWYLNFQTINMMVHYNEKLHFFVGKDNDECRRKLASLHPHYFTALKMDYTSMSHGFGVDQSGNEERFYSIPMEPEDYKHFTYQKPKGWLELDFGTVGKDLLSCSWTDDIELVKKGGLSQQVFHHPWVAYGWVHFENDIHHTNNLDTEYLKWIEDNNVGDYIDLEDPKYTPGRHMLGQCINIDIDNPEDFIKNIIEKTPKIAGIILTDDDNKTIL